MQALNDGLEQWDIEFHSGLVSCVAWHPDGQCLASGGHDGQLKVWNIGSRACTRSICAHAGSIWSMSWAAQIGFLASGGNDACLNIWDFSDDAQAEDKPLLSLSLSRNNAALFIYAVGWAPHTELLAAGSSDGRMRTWKVQRAANGQPEVTSLRNFGGLAAVRSLSWSPCGEQLAYAGSDSIICVHLSPAKSEEDPRSFGQSMSWYTVSWCPDKSHETLVAGNSVGEVVMFRMEDGVVIFRCVHPSAVLVVAWSPGAKQIVSGSRDGSIRIFDVPETSLSGTQEKFGRSGLGMRCFSIATQPKEETDETDELGSLAWAPEGRRISFGLGNGKIQFRRPAEVTIGTSRCDKRELQDKFGVLLCEWACNFASQASTNLPALAFEGRLVTSTRMQWVKRPEFGLASFVAAVTVDFHRSVMVEQTEASVIPQNSTRVCCFSALRSAIAGQANKINNGCRAVYFVFRGSVDIHNWIHNLNIQLNKQAYKTHGVNVHSSFQLEIDNRNFLELSEFKETLSVAIREGSDVIFTGHSQGGAHATVLFTDLSLRQSAQLHQSLGCSQSSTRRMLEHARLVAFAAPTVFAKEGHPSEAFSKIMSRGRNYILRNDPVPRSYSKVPDWAPEMLNQLKSSAVSTILPMVPWVVRPSEAEMIDHLDSIDLNRLLDVVNIAAVEAVARSYFHAMEIVVIAGGGRNWDEFDVTPAAFSDHDIKAYADFLCVPDSQTHKQIPAPR